MRRCDRCYGNNHGERDCISVPLAGLNQVRPKCRHCRGFGHEEPRCPSKLAKPIISNVVICDRCNGKNHRQTVCVSPHDAGRCRVAPRCNVCGGWGHLVKNCPSKQPKGATKALPSAVATGGEAEEDEESLRAKHLWNLSHALFGTDPELSRFYIDRMTDELINADMQMLEERKVCQHCSTLQVCNVTSMIRSRAEVSLKLPRSAPAVPKDTAVQGSVVYRCLVCGEKRVEHGKLRRLRPTKGDTGAAAKVAAAQEKKRKRKKSKVATLLQKKAAVAPVDMAATRRVSAPASYGTLQDFLTGL